MIIIPPNSSWYGIWKLIINASLIYGYFNDPQHIAFVLSREEQNVILEKYGRTLIPDLNVSM